MILFLIGVIAVIWYLWPQLIMIFNTSYPVSEPFIDPYSTYSWGANLWGQTTRPFYEYNAQPRVPHPYQNECHEIATKQCRGIDDWNCYPEVYNQCKVNS